jgi:WD40 repeat protein
MSAYSTRVPTLAAGARLAVAFGVVICSAAGSSAAAEKAGGGKLAYQVHGPRGRSWIVASNIDGTNVRPLVPTTRHDWSEYSWSPDGNKLAAEADAIVVARDGGPSRIVVPATRRTRIVAVRWSPKNNRLAFTRSKRTTCAGAAVWVVDATGMHRQRLTRPTGLNSFVTTEDWSPDGKRLLYQAMTYEADECANSRFALRSRLITVGRDGSSPRVVTNIKYGAERAAWSPSGSKIAYLTCAFTGQLPCQVWVVDVTGSNRHRVGPEVNMWSGIGLKWTRDGREIVTPYLCAPGDCVPLANYCDAKTWSGGLRAIDIATGHTRSLVSRPGCTSAKLLAISRSDSTVAFVWVALDGSVLGPPMLLGLDGRGSRALPPPPKIAGGSVEPLPAFYLP